MKKQKTARHTKKYPRQLHEDGRLYGKYKVFPDRQIPVEDLQAALEGRQLSTGHRPHFVKPLRDKSYMALVFHVGARKLEAIKTADHSGILKEDMVVTDTAVVFKIPAFKHGERAGPLELDRTKPGVDLIVQQWQRTRKGRPIWQLSASTAYRVMIRALGVCPHWLRHSFITGLQQKLEGQPSEVDRKIMSWTGIKRRETLDSYRLKKLEDIKDVSRVKQ